ncbi:hypothetical protein CHLRE_02g082200v5 [Chlamydomonas reinhardtii]|uniref:Homoserine kinase n=1 Tax=Chlamydomonas reinhardtii TaxID=3055 RepID=A0A2K3E0L4_CHLRE|nr:uncharacterized protein CHLRE_02g082200v5 [Chlamydomonas reinhardtii]PNW86328.1 hypothetical protein CHLRE_02g082200v5 [Chlamydomonas reinhardtii]
MSSGCGRSELRKALAEELSRLAVAEGRAEDEQRLRLDAERRALAAERLLDVVAALLDMLVTAAVVTLVVFVGGFGALAPLYIVFVSWRCRDLLPRPQRQWRGVMAAAVTVACAACCVSMVVASAGFVSQAVAHAAFYPCVALLAARAALVTLTRVVRSCGDAPLHHEPRITSKQGLPLGSGMGSSAAAAAAWAVNALFGAPVPKDKLILAGLDSEAAVSGYHADNVGPSLLGGFVLIRSCKPGEPVELLQLPFPNPERLHFVLVNRKFEAPTAQMRAVLPKETPMKSMINNCCQGGALVAGILTGDVKLVGESLDRDVIIEPVRAPLIPGMMAVKEAAKAAGAYGCTISGAGPTAVAIVDDPAVGARVAEAMSAAFRNAGKLDVNTAQVVKLDPEGAKFV